MKQRELTKLILQRRGPGFQEEVEKLVSEKKIGYMDAVIYWCETRGIEIELAGEFVKKCSVIKNKIKAEAVRLNCMKK